MGLGIAFIVVALFVFHAITLEPPLTLAAQLTYALLSLVLAGWYAVVIPRTGQVVARHGEVWVLPGFCLGAGLIFVIALFLRGQAKLYFYLLAFDGYGALLYFTGKSRWAVVGVVGVMALAWLSYAMFLGSVAGASALLGDLPWYGLIVALTEFTMRQWQQRERVEAMAAELAEAHRRLQDYATQAEALAVAQERARLAHEIHDSVGHTLTALDVQLELLVRLPPDRTEQRQQAAEQARALVKEGLTDVRRAVQALRPAALETFSLPEAIAGLVAEFERTTQIRTTWQVEGEIAPLPARVALPLYRTAQEALTNVQRHAPAAQQVRLVLDYGPEVVGLCAENDGVRPTSPANGTEMSSGYGLQGLRERAEALGGTFSARLDEAGSFRVEMRLPRTG